uniref:Uncharacterized protein n=1 Tax=Coccidioides posadasii RMSCC 3488 TaxID=454284 RepID=A0A0J6F8K2_COCPO|nr:hypothetical protein CPAG_05663 [Coccidioides posadasii RMSCC 3488]
MSWLLYSRCEHPPGDQGQGGDLSPGALVRIYNYPEPKCKQSKPLVSLTLNVLTKRRRAQPQRNRRRTKKRRSKKVTGDNQPIDRLWAAAAAATRSLGAGTRVRRLTSFHGG